jgi:hypothetical protein
MRPGPAFRRILRRTYDAWIGRSWGRVAGSCCRARIGVRRRVLVCDIDNTLAATREYAPQSPFRQPTNGFFAAIPPIASMVQVVKNISSSADTYIIYLSARPFRSYSVTRVWLGSQALRRERDSVVLVPSPRAKVDFMRALTSGSAVQTLMIDDLSYDLDGRVLSYDQEVAALRELPLTLYGLEFIKQIRQEAP